MRRVLVTVASIVAVVAVGLVIAGVLRQWNELRRRNSELANEVTRLTKELAAVPPQATWEIYESKRYGFELRYPLDAFGGASAKVTDALARNGMAGLSFSGETAPCTLEVYVGPASATSNPFDESGVSPNESRYAASTRLEFGGIAYHVGMAVVSHAVLPQTCDRTLKEILPTFRLIPGWAPSAGSSGRGSMAGLSQAAAERLRMQGLLEPEQALRRDLMRHPELIPFRGVLGGTPGFHEEKGIVVMGDRWVYAPFDDGHVQGAVVAAWEVSTGGAITWKVVDAMCPGC